MLFAKVLIRPSHCRAVCGHISTLRPSRSLLTLAIESSCDDTSVAILEKHDTPEGHGACATLHFHEKITSDNSAYNGIHPLVALTSHSKNLATLVQKAFTSLPINHDNDNHTSSSSVVLHDGSIRRKPDFISVTRGPGMRSNLACGLDTAKGLSVAWQIPLLGVHHMQAHALTPRLASALQNKSKEDTIQPKFPFLSLLISGGHSMLIHSKSLTEHTTMATTHDTAIGEALDKIGRDVLSPDLLQGRKDTMYAKVLSEWVYPTPESMEEYSPPLRRGDEMVTPTSPWGWRIRTPFSDTRELKFSFSGLATQAHRIMERPDISDDERFAVAKRALIASFEHLASRTIIGLQALRQNGTEIETLVLSGGVAANLFLRHLMRRFLDVRGFEHVALAYPPVELCTDNAAMIAWTGIEMWEAGFESELTISPIRRWSMDSSSSSSTDDTDDALVSEFGSGILGVDGWKRRA